MCVRVSNPRWMVRMCLWMPAAVLSTLPQFFHRHLNITFMEFCRKHTKYNSNSQKTQELINGLVNALILTLKQHSSITTE